MGDGTKLGLGILGAAVVLGVLGDGLLRATPWGINLPLWVGGLVLAAVVLIRWARLEFAGEGRWLVLVALLFSAGVAWRDSPTVVALDLLAVLVSLFLAVLRGRSGALRRAGVSEYVAGGAYVGALSSAGPLPVAGAHVRWSEVARGRWREPALAAARGIFVAAPLLLVFGALFVAADAVFEGIVRGFFGFDLESLLGHLGLAVFFAWITSGLLWVALLAHRPESLAVPRPRIISLGVVEVGIVLGLLDALFAAFVVVQVRYLFGSATRVLDATGLTYAEYARRGFFELVTVTALTLPLLLLLHWLLLTESRTGRLVFRVLAGTLVALLFVVMASAFRRMYLYTQQFGLTELRLYASLFMAWIFIVLLWFLLTVLRDRRDRFAFGALLSGFAAILLINALNPDALIARTNIARFEAGLRFDAAYLASLSADAVPVLVEALPEIGDQPLDEDAASGASEEPLPTLEEEVRARWRKEPDDWRTWNLSRSRAYALSDAAAASTRPAGLT